MQWLTIFQKEALENWRSMKWVWVPLVFILLSISDPLSTYYLPIILDKFGDLPEGAEIPMMEYAPTEVFMMSIGQLNVMGILIILLMTMGLIAGERKSGVIELILVKPVSYTSYITAKYASNLALVLFSTFLGLLVSWYYVNLLFGEVTVMQLVTTFFFYGVWLMFVLSISILMNSIFKVPGLIGFLSVSTVTVLSIVNGIVKRKFEWLPSQLTGYTRNYLATGVISTDLWITTGIALLVTFSILVISITLFRKKELAS